MIVLDASAVIELLLNSDVGTRVSQRIAEPAESLHAPHVLSIEVTQVLRRYVSSRSVDVVSATAALEDLADLDIARYAHEPFLQRIWELRNNLTSCDAAYVALAEVLDAPLLTLDGRIAAAPGHSAIVEIPE